MLETGISLYQQSNETSLLISEYDSEKNRGLFPNFQSIVSIKVGPKCNIFINDLMPFITQACDQPKLDELMQFVANSSKREVVVLDMEEVSTQLTTLLSAQLTKINNPAFLFPGEGGSILLKYLQKCSPKLLENSGGVFAFPCQRSFSKDGKCNGIRITLPKVFNPNTFDSFIIFDDVLLTGETARAIKWAVYDLIQDDNEWDGNLKFPAINQQKKSFRFLSWLALDPNQRPKRYLDMVLSSVSELESMASVICYSGAQGIPPCNSLSTLVRNNAKAELVKQGLKSKYFDSLAFDELINYLKQRVNFNNEE